MKDISLPIHFVRAVTGKAANRGHSVEALLKKAGISPRLIVESQARVSAEQFARLQLVTMQELDDEMLGYSAYPAKLGQWSAACHWLISCKTLGQALRRYCLFYDMVEFGLKTSLRTEADTAYLTFSPRHGEREPLEPYAYELSMYTAHRLMCWLTETRPPLESINFDYNRPDHAEEYRRMFLGVAASFSRDACSIVFKRKLLGLPMVQTVEALNTFLRNPLYYLLANEYQSFSWTQRIQNLLGNDLSNLPSFLEIANTLDVNPKRLRRLLNEEGLTYSELKLQLRRDVAIYHLSRQDTSVEDIAFKTGFSESSAFIRAFKKWTGVTPYTYRKDLS